jgi:DNA-binding NarL/FixJ family response regulator
MNIRVLILADHPMIRLGVRAALTAAPDVEVVGETSDGRDVVPWAQKVGPDLVLIDLSTTNGDSFDAVRRIRQHCPGVRVLALGAADPPVARRASEAGATGVLSKDISPVELANAVHAIRAGDTGAPRGPGSAPVTTLAGERTARWGLTEREWEVLVEIARGLSAREIAAKLYLSTSTVKSHVRAIYRQLGLRNRAQAVLFLVERCPRLVHGPLGDDGT